MKPSSRRKILKAALVPSPISEAVGLEAQLKQEFDNKTHAQYFMEHGYSLQQVEGMAGAVSGLIGSLGVEIPEFAKKASKQFWKYLIGKELNISDSIEDLGVMSGIAELHVKNPASTPKSELEKHVWEFAIPMVQELEKAVRAMSPNETAQFYVGRARAASFLEKTSNPDYLKMVKRAPIYIIIAIVWRRFEQFTSQAEAERWLRSEKIIEANVDSSEVRAVFRLLGLRYRGPGRPKKP